MNKRVCQALGITALALIFAISLLSLFTNVQANNQINNSTITTNSWSNSINSTGLVSQAELDEKLLARQAQLQSARQRKQQSATPLAWLIDSPAFPRVSTAAHYYLTNKYQLNREPSLAKNSAAESLRQLDQAMQNKTANFGTAESQNVRVNDPLLENGFQLQNQTASASFENNVVIVFNQTNTGGSGVSFSSDGGASWQETALSPILGGRNIGDCMVAVDGDGNFYASSVGLNQVQQPTISVSLSPDGGASWFPGSDAVTTDVKPRYFHDRPWLAVDSSNSKFRNNIYVSWTRFDDIDKRSSIMISRATTRNLKFNKPIEVTPQATGFNVGGSRMALGPNGEVYLSWFDFSTKSVMLVKSIDGGATFSKPVTIVSLGNQPTPEFLNGRFQTNTFGSLAVDLSDSPTRGQVYFAYNARPGFNTVDKSDVYIIRSLDGGQNWTAPLRMNDDQTATDQWMPSITVTTSGKIAALWYDRRNDVKNNAMVDVFMASSLDGGNSFRANVRVTDSNWPLLPTPNGLPFGYHGEYNQISARGENVNLHWGDDRNGLHPDVFAASLPIDATPIDDFTLTGGTISTAMRSNAQTSILFESLRSKSFANRIVLTAVSNLPGATFQFSPSEIDAGNSFNLTINVPANTRPDTYSVNVIGDSRGRKRATSARIVVLGDRIEAKPVINFTRNPGESIRPQLAADSDGRLHMIWQDDTNGAAQIFYTNSLDGVNFSTPVDISRTFESANNPAIGIDEDGSIHIVWQEQKDQGNFIVYTRSDDHGTTFLPKRIISPGYTRLAATKISVGQRGMLGLVWSAIDNQGNTGVFYTSSFDNGDNFSTPKTIAATKDVAIYDPTVLIDAQGNIHIAYAFLLARTQRFNNFTYSAAVFYQRSNDSGGHFTEPVRVTSTNFSLSDSPVLFVNEAGTIFLLFSGFNNQDLFPSREIYFARSFDNGASFYFGLESLSKGNGDSTSIAAAFDPNGILNVVWRDTQNGNFDIYMSRLFPGEEIFTAPFNLSLNVGISEHPAIVIDNRGSMTIAWDDETTGNSEIVLKQLAQFELPPVKITGFSPALSASGETVEVTGENFRDTLEVKVGELSAVYKILADDRMIITVPSGAVTGRILVFGKTGLTRSEDDLLIKDKINVVPTKLDFDSAILGQSVTKTLKVVNTSNISRKVTQISFTNPGFELENVKLPFTIPANSSTDITIVFKPDILGLQGARIVIISDDGSLAPLQAELTGSGLDGEAPKINLETPAGGETFRPFEQVEIIWQAQDNTAIERQDLQLSTDGGKTFPITIASNLSGTRKFVWMVPEINTRTARIRLTVVDVAGNRSETINADNFRIKMRKKKNVTEGNLNDSTIPY